MKRRKRGKAGKKVGRNEKRSVRRSLSFRILTANASTPPLIKDRTFDSFPHTETNDSRTLLNTVTCNNAGLVMRSPSKNKTLLTA